MDLAAFPVARCTSSGDAYTAEDMAQVVEMETVLTRFVDECDINCGACPDSWKRFFGVVVQRCLALGPGLSARYP
jgi:hypothetical protein